MIATCLRSGVRAAFAHRRLIATVWVWNLALALIAGVGTSRWLGAAFNVSPEADKTLQRFQFSTLIELQQYDRFSPATFLGGAVLALLIVSALSNPLLSAGVLEVLASRDDRPLLHRFFRGAGHFYGRFFRLLALSAVAFLVLALVVSAVVGPVTRALSNAGWERAWLTVAVSRLVLVGCVAALVMAVLDVARARVVTAPTEIRGMLRVWAGAWRVVIGHFGALAGIYLALGVAWIGLALAGLGIVSSTPVTTWAGIWFLIAVQQIFMVARAALRVARAGAVLQCVSLTARPAASAEARQDSAYPADSPVSV